MLYIVFYKENNMDHSISLENNMIEEQQRDKLNFINLTNLKKDNI